MSASGFVISLSLSLPCRPVDASYNPYANDGIAYGGSYGSSGSLAHNPTVAPIDLTVQGSDFLWAVFAVMLATGLGVTAWSYTLPAGTRAFHTLSVIVLITASVACASENLISLTSI